MHNTSCNPALSCTSLLGTYHHTSLHEGVVHASPDQPEYSCRIIPVVSSILIVDSDVVSVQITIGTRFKPPPTLLSKVIRTVTSPSI